MDKVLAILGFVIVVTLAVCGSAMSADVYVNYNTGNDTTGDGSSGSPYKTFHKGYTEASAGDRVICMGTFDWSVDTDGVASPTGYTIAKNITVIGYGASNTIFQAQPSAGTSIDRCVLTIDATVTIENCTVRYGYVASNGSYGGGITVNEGRSLTIRNSTITQNVFSGGGNNIGSAGGVLAEGSNTTGGTLVMEYCTVSDNTHEQYSYYGSGGVYGGYHSNITVKSSTITGNTATDSYTTPSNACVSGGFGSWTFAPATLINCTVTNNSTNRCGGGVHLDYTSDHYLTNNTIAGNSAGVAGGGVLYGSQAGGYELIMRNNIIANNTADGGGNDMAFYNSGSTLISDQGYNLVEFSPGYSFSATGDITGDQANLWGTGIAATPSLADNGGDTLTIALSAGSVAVNHIPQTAGGNTYNGCPVVDQRNYTRPTGSGDSDNRDLGAFELGAPLSIDLVSFTARRFPQHVRVAWETEAEVDTSGFHLWRADAANKDFVRVTEWIIPAVGGPAQGAEYFWLDTTAAPGAQYWYKLEEITDGGLSVYHGPVKAMGKRPGVAGQ